MYEQVFQLNSRPFTATPYVKHYFAGDAIHTALGQARVCIDRGTGPVIVIGGTGTGKSLLLAMLEEQYQAQFNVVNLACARLGDRRELLQSVLFELQLPFKDQSETELRFSLIDYLKPSEQCPNGVLLLVDEGHTLSTDLLDELRLIMNVVRDGQPRVRLVMAGSQRLEENLNDSKLESFNQRIASRCYLQSMSREETARYVTEHIDRAGGNGCELFSPESLRAVHEVSEGCPRLVNQVCDQALILAATQGLDVISEEFVMESWSIVQSIPSSFKSATSEFRSNKVTELKSDESWTVIEFGQLEDEDEPAEQTAQECESDPTCDSESHSRDQLSECDATESESWSEQEVEHTELGFAESDSMSEEDSLNDVESLSDVEELSSVDSLSDVVSLSEPDDVSDEDNLQPEMQLADDDAQCDEESADCAETTQTEEFEYKLQDDDDESFVGWDSDNDDRQIESWQSSTDEQDSTDNEYSDTPGSESVESCEKSAEEYELATEATSEADPKNEQEPGHELAAELAAVFGSVPTEDTPTSSASIKDLEMEQDQIIEQVETDKRETFGLTESVTTAGAAAGAAFIYGSETNEDVESENVETSNSVPDETQDEFENEEVSSLESFEPASNEHATNDQCDPVAEESCEDEEAEQALSDPQLRQPVETVDPFSESFDEEENLIDRYAPFVAHQNQSSLSVTSEQLSMLTPVDELTEMDSKGLANDDAQVEADRIVSGSAYDTEEPVADSFVDAVTETLPLEGSDSDSNVEGSAADKAIQWASSTESLADVSNLNESAEVEVEAEHADVAEHAEVNQVVASEEEAEPAQPTGESQPNLHEHVSEASSTDIQQQAEAILRRLNVSQDVSCETESTVNSSLSQVCELNDKDSSETEFERQNAALDESQQILNEILQQKNELAQVRETTIRSFTESSPRPTPSIKIEYPAASTDSDDLPRDDREMIIINRMEEPSEQTDQPEPAVPFPSTPISTGRAERMDYQKLFNQLRDISNSQE